MQKYVFPELREEHHRIGRWLGGHLPRCVRIVTDPAKTRRSASHAGPSIAVVVFVITILALRYTSRNARNNVQRVQVSLMFPTSTR